MFRDESEDKMQRRADILFPTMKDKKEKVTLEKENNKKIPGLGVSKFDFDKDDDDEDITNSKKQDNKEWAEILADYVNKQKKESREDILYPTMKDKTEKHNEDDKQDLDVKKIKINKKDIGYVTGGAASSKFSETINNNSNDHNILLKGYISYDKSDQNFNDSLVTIFGHEGGYTNDPDDLGGPTNMGITQSTYNSYCKKHNIKTKDVKNLSEKLNNYNNMQN